MSMSTGICAQGMSPVTAGIHDPPAVSARVRHTIPSRQLQALASQRLGDASVSRLLLPDLKRLLGGRFDEFKASMADEQPLRMQGQVLIGEGVVPGTLGYRGAFFLLGDKGEMLAVLKSGHHGTTIERFGSLDLLKDRAALHAYQEFVGIDE